MQAEWPHIQIAGGFFLLLALLLLTGEGIAGPFLFACAVYEAGHLLTLYAVGGRLAAIRFMAGGAEMRIAAVPRLSYPAELLSVWAGPLAGLILALLAAHLGFFVTAGVSLVLTIFNLLPLSRQDGRRLLYLLLAWRTGPETARSVTTAVSRSISLLLLLLGVWTLVCGGGVLLLLVGMWIITCQMPERSIK